MHTSSANAVRRPVVVGAALALALLAGCGGGDADGGPGGTGGAGGTSTTGPAASGPTSTSTATAPTATGATTPATRTTTPVETLGAGQLIELPKGTEWVEPTDEPYRFAMPAGWDTLDIRAIRAGAPPEENTLRWARERRIDLGKVVASDARAGWSMRLLRTNGSSQAGPVAYVLARWQPGRAVPDAGAAVSGLTATGVKAVRRTTPLGTAWVVTGDVSVGSRRLPMARILVNTPEGLARIHLVGTFAAERDVVVETIARTVSYR